MKIVCEACQAKYSISDDKVRGKAFKIRCKKCSHIIVVRAGDGAATAAAQSADLMPTVSSADAPSVASGAETTWHIVVDGEQVGPLPESDIRGRLARGEISGDTYIWREGLADWQKISAVADFADAFAGGAGGYDDGASPFGQPAPTTVYPPGTAETAFSASQQRDADPFSAATVAVPSPAPDLFASPVAAAAAEAAPPSSFSFGGGRGDSGLRASSNGAGAGGGMAVAPSGLTGQRHENSVLFSLSNLEALAQPTAPASVAPKPGLSSSTTEGSGLIDIRSMAAMTLGKSDDRAAASPDLPAFGAPQFSPVAPVLLPIAAPSGPPKWLYAALGVLVLIMLVLGVVTYKVFTAPPPAPVVVAPPPVTSVAPAPAPTAAKPAEPPVTPPPATNEALPPREEPKAGDKGGDRKVAKAPSRDTKKGSSGKSEPAPAPVAAAPAPKEPEKPAAPQKTDKLDDLLASALGGKKPAPRTDDDPAPAKKAEPAKSLPSLQREDIVAAMKGVQGKVKDCYNQYKVPGTAFVKLSVSNGRVSSVNVTGKFAGTPTGSCVESAVRGAKFPPSQPQTIDYPFALN